MIAVIASARDIAGMNIKRILIESYGFKGSGKNFEGFEVYKKRNYNLITTKKDSIWADHLDEHFDPEIYIFASRHSSRSGMPCMTSHSTGNFGDNKFGGNKRELSISNAMANSSALRFLNENQVGGFEVCFEVTHHGPTNLKRPLVFVEVGSTEKEWKKMNVCEVVAEAIMNLSFEGISSEIGFGGPHYAPKFTALCLEGRNIGHICPKYHLDLLDEELFKQMIEKTVPRPKKAVIDRKGVKGRHKQLIIELAEKHKLEVDLV